MSHYLVYRFIGNGCTVLLGEEETIEAETAVAAARQLFPTARIQRAGRNENPNLILYPVIKKDGRTLLDPTARVCNYVVEL